MKGGLAAMAEAAQVIVESGVRLKGDLLLGRARPARGAGWAWRGPVGPGPPGNQGRRRDHHRAGVRHAARRGARSGRRSISRSTETRRVHVTSSLTPPDTPHPILAAVRLVNLMQARHNELRARQPIPYVGHESFFVGILQGGDFFNRWTNACRLVGTRRYGPENSYANVLAELRAMAAQVRAGDRGAGGR
ncbi:MAG: peptidase dimerization domain-containing protein [Rhodopseudomonas palustris]|nr:peptidase dimerization domain-containing protein [Rhodopseudomonas palustris]